MNPDKYTERSRGFLQSAQTLAQRSGHQRLAPEHLLKVLLDDREGLAANLMRAAGADPQKALVAVEAELAKQPKVEGSGAPAGLPRPRTRARLRAGREGRGEGRRFLRNRRTSPARACDHAGFRRAEGARRREADAAVVERRDRAGAQGPQGRQRLGRGELRRAQEVRATSPKPRARASSIR
jgi:ATP-dependent Clp protease ATP-binding subunit ClpA